MNTKTILAIVATTFLLGGCSAAFARPATHEQFQAANSTEIEAANARIAAIVAGTAEPRAEGTYEQYITPLQTQTQTSLAQLKLNAQIQIMMMQSASLFLWR